MASKALGIPDTGARRGPLQRGLAALLALPWMPLGAVLVSLLLCSPVLSAGLIADDYIHKLVLRGAAALPAYKQHWSGLFAFATPDNTRVLMEEGVLPWWSDPELRFAFFRPVSALTHALDMQLWPETPWLMHAHSLLWSALALFAAYALYLRVFALAEDDARETRGLARLSLLFYALEPTRAVAVGWIANRNTLVSLSLSLAAVCLHLDELQRRARESSQEAGKPGRFGAWRVLIGRVLGPACLALAVLAGEGGVSGLAFLIAAALMFDVRGAQRGLLALLPHFAAVGCVIAWGSALGYGVDGSDGYLDPRREPLSYLAAFPARALALITAGLGGPAADATGMYELLWPGLGIVMKLVSLALVGVLGWALAPLVFQSRSARYFCLALCLALPPACVAYPADRLLTWISVSAVALLAECAMFALRNGNGAAPRRLLVTAAAVLGARVLFAPLLLLAQAQNLPNLGELLARADRVIPVDQSIHEKVAVFVNAPQEPLVSFVLPRRAADEVPRPRALRRMAAGFSHVAITRVGETRVEVYQDGGFLRQHTERLMRSPRTRPFAVGDRVTLPDMQAEILSIMPDGRPRRVVFDFDPKLHLFYALSTAGYEEFKLPALGQCIELATPSFLEFVLGADNTLAQLLRPTAAGDLCESASR